VLDQAQYVHDVLLRFRPYLKNTKKRGNAPSTPLPVKMDMKRATADDRVVDHPYRELIGSIGHLAIGTRIDLALHVSLFSRFVSR